MLHATPKKHQDQIDADSLDLSTTEQFGLTAASVYVPVPWARDPPPQARASSCHRQVDGRLLLEAGREVAHNVTYKHLETYSSVRVVLSTTSMQCTCVWANRRRP